MVLSQKTGYTLLLISALFSFLQAIYNIASQSALLFGNIALVCFGLGVLMIILKARHKKFLFYSCIAAVIVAVFIYIPYGPRLAIAFACLAPFAYDEKAVPRIVSGALMAFGLIGIASFFVPFTPLIGAIIFACAAACHAIFAWLNIRYEDGMER